MANIKVMHKAAVISTDLTIKEIKKLEALNPDCLAIKDAEGNVRFNIATSSKESISRFGIVFNNDSRISVLIDANKINRDVVEELFGAVLLQLSEIEKKAVAYLDSVSVDLDDLIEIDGEFETESDVEYLDEEE